MPTITAEMPITAENQQQQRRQQERHSNSSEARNNRDGFLRGCPEILEAEIS
jgi:hypothetical protein